MLNKFALISLLVGASMRFDAAEAATVKSTAGDITYAETTPWGDIEIDFSRCMANELYTFSEVRLNGQVINHTESDNIGPFLVDRKGWMGGNHLNGDRRSARTVSVRASVDGNPLSADAGTKGRVLTVDVVNDLLNPVTDSLMCIERMTYEVSGNSITVTARHEFLNPEPEVIERYFGMQSMMVGETDMLTPGGAFARWTPTLKRVNSSTTFPKSEAPSFCTFIERSPAGYQAAYMTSEGLGSRSQVDEGDFVFINACYNVNSVDSKSYHKLIGMRPVCKGDKTMWHGVYSWFDKPISDRSDSETPTFDYGAYRAGRPYVFHLGPDGRMTEKSL